MTSRRSSFPSKAKRLAAAWDHLCRLPDPPAGEGIAAVYAVAEEHDVSVGLVAPMLIRLRRLREAGQDPSSASHAP